MMKAAQTKFGLVFLWLGVAFALSGCGGPFDASAEGVVTLDGKALERGNVAFHPASGGPAAYAMISDGGHYTLQTGRESGLPAGEYQVSVTANEPPASAQGKGGGPPPLGKSITPAWYASKDTSGLRVTVKPGRNDIPLELKSTPPTGWKPGAK